MAPAAVVSPLPAAAINGFAMSKNKGAVLTNGTAKPVNPPSHSPLTNGAAAVNGTNGTGGLAGPGATAGAAYVSTDHLGCVDDLIRERAASIPDTVLVSYPSAQDRCADWVEYTSRDLDAYADEAAKELTRLGLVPKERKSTKSEVVALLGPSDLDYAIALLALTRMGFAVLFLSTRLPVEAYVSLLDKTSCSRMLTTPRFADSVNGIRAQRPLETFSIPAKEIYARPPQGPRFEKQTSVENQADACAFIVHSSGSTGLPKPILQSHRACLSNYATGSGMRGFTTLPLFHNSGIATTFRGIVAGKRTALYNAAVPLTNRGLVEGMRAVDPQSFYCVPYALKILAETDEGVAALARCEVVIFVGSGCPDELGDLLVGRGVHLVAHYGQTEMGQLMMSNRPRSDKTWNYMRPLASVKPFLVMDPIGEDQYEVVVLDGLPSKVMSNSDSPKPNSYRTRDTFVKHPTIPDAWKHVGRLDDRVTLVNGEKVLPIPIEGCIRQDELVRECLIFGLGRALPGLLVVPSEAASPAWSRDEYLDRIWPTIQRANARAEKFSQIEREMVEVLPADADYPRTDKGTIIRAAAYQRFADLINAVYTRFETPGSGGNANTRSASGDAQRFETYLLQLCRERLGLKDIEPETDLFAAGMDSLQAIVARGHMMRQLDLGGAVLGQNVVFEHPSARKLAAHLASLLNNTGSPAGAVREVDDPTVEMRQLVDKYGDFEAFVPGDKVPDGDVVLLTGATGSLGAHVLSQLLPLPHIRRVYCLVRAPDAAAATARVFSSLSARGLGASLTPSQAAKIVALPSDLSQPTLGLEDSILAELRSSLTAIVHAAWAVNFNLSVASLAGVHVAGVQNLLRLALSVPFAQPARFSFISSVSSASGTPLPARIPETFVADARHAQGMGYARSKWVAEHVVRRACEANQDVGFGGFARVLRTGQVVGDSRQGKWNATEAIPLMIRAAQTLGALPRLDESPSWIPVDVCAAAVLELSGLRPREEGDHVEDPGHVIYHVLNPRTFRWTEDLLPALREAGLEFEEVGQREWVRRLREGEQDPVRNPTVKLLDFFAAKYDNDLPGRKGLVFETEKTERRSPAVAGRFDVIGSGLMGKCVETWRKEWSS